MQLLIEIGSDLTEAQLRRLVAAIDITSLDAKVYSELVEAAEYTDVDADSVWVENIKVVDL